MTQARSLLVPANAHGIYHCISRCVRRAWLCGRDPLSGADDEHRRQWVEDRLEQLAGIYAVSVWAYAVMSNHLHVVVEMHADIAADWLAEAVAERWLGLYPPEDGQYEAAKAMIVGNDARLAVLRSRLCSLSWVTRRDGTSTFPAQRRDIHFSNQSSQWLSPRRGAALRTALNSAIGVIFWVAAGM